MHLLHLQEALPFPTLIYCFLSFFPGGYFVHGMTKTYLDFVPALKDLEPLMDTMVEEGIWEKVERKVLPKVLSGKDGLFHVYKIK